MNPSEEKRLSKQTYDERKDRVVRELSEAFSSGKMTMATLEAVVNIFQGEEKMEIKEDLARKGIII